MSVYASLAGIGLIFLLFSLYILYTLGDREWGIFSKWAVKDVFSESSVDTRFSLY